MRFLKHLRYGYYFLIIFSNIFSHLHNFKLLLVKKLMTYYTVYTHVFVLSWHCCINDLKVEGPMTSLHHSPNRNYSANSA